MPDTQGKPTYDKQSCPVCSSQKPGICWTCAEGIPPYPAVPEGYLAPTADHFHFAAVGGIAALTAIIPVVCRECYLEAFASAYPNEALPSL